VIRKNRARPSGSPEKNLMRICLRVSSRATRRSKMGNGGSVTVADPLNVGGPTYPVPVAAGATRWTEKHQT